jgi:hypothetical protein
LRHIAIPLLIFAVPSKCSEQMAVSGIKQFANSKSLSLDKVLFPKRIIPAICAGVKLMNNGIKL